MQFSQLIRPCDNSPKFHLSFHFNPLFRVYHIDLRSLIYVGVWSGGRSFLKNFQKGGGG